MLINFTVKDFWNIPFSSYLGISEGGLILVQHVHRNLPLFETALTVKV